MLPLEILSLGLWVIVVDAAFITWHFFHNVQIALLKFTSCDNQVLVGCIPIAAVAVHLKLKS